MAELGAYYITVMPSMKGFSSAVNKQLKGLGSAGGTDYSNGFMSVLKGSAIGTVLGNLATRAGSSIMGGLKAGIGRIDTLENFPKVMKALGFETKDAEKSVALIMKRLDGLPTTTQEIVTFTQSIADSTGNLDLATRAALGFNDMMLANGASAGEVTQAQGVLNRVLGKGNATVAQWQSIQSVMPAQLAAVARELLGQSGSVEELRDKLNDGTISWDEFLQAVVKLDEQGSGAMASFEEQARANSNGIGTALENIPNRIGQGWAAIIKEIGREDIAKAISTMSYGVRDAMIGIGNAIGTLKEELSKTQAFQNLQTIMEGVGSAFDGFGAVVGDAVNAAIPILADLIDDVLQWLVDHGEDIKGIADKISEGFGSIADKVGGALKDALPVAEDFVSDVLQWLLDHGDTVAVTIGSIAGAVAGFTAAQGALTIITGIATSLGALGMVLPMISGLADIPVAFALVAETGGPLAGLFGGISAALGFLAANPVVLAIGAIGALVGGLAAWIMTTEEGKQAWEDFCAGLSELWTGLQEDWSELCAVMQREWESFQTFIDGIPEWWEGVKKYWSDAMAEQAENFRKSWEKIKQDFSDALDQIKKTANEKWEALKSDVSGIIDDLKEKAKQKWEDLKEKVQTTIENLKKAAYDKWHAMKTDATDVWDAIKNAIKEKIEWAYNKVKEIVDKIKGLFNFEWSLPAPKLPSIDVNWTDFGGISLPSFSVNWFGDGGVFDSAAIIGIGERGREAAMPMNDAVYSEIARGIYRQMPEGDGGVTIEKLADTIIIRETADVDEVMDRINQRTRRERQAMA